MPIQPNFRKQSQFPQGDALKRGVSAFEDEVGKAFSNVATQAFPKLVPTDVKVADYESKLDDLVLVDSSSGATINITLPVATSDNRGRGIGIVRMSSMGAVILISQTDIDGAGTSLPLPLTVGLYTYLSEGA